MRCLVCGAEMHLMDVVQDVTMPVPGYEHRVFTCCACGDIERRVVFTGHIGPSHTKPVSVHTAPPISPAPISQKECITASAILRRVFAKLRGVCRTVERRLAFSHGKAPRFIEPVSLATTPDILAPPAEPVSEPPLEVPKTPLTSLHPAEAPSVPTAPHTAVSPERDNDLDECEALLRRAIEMVRGPARSSQITASVTKARSGTPSELVSSMRAERPPASRVVVRINHDPQKAKYVATDTESGFSILRHQDSARLRAMCDRMGWQVVDGAVANAGD
jgi:hypothetical protein